MKRLLILLSIAAFLLSCSASRTDKDWKIYVHPKGWHAIDPVAVQFGKWPEVFQMQVMFDSTCKYVFYTSTGAIAENQYDYNKAGGWSFDEVSARKNSCMMGWRYGVESRKIELTFLPSLQRRCCPSYRPRTRRFLQSGSYLYHDPRLQHRGDL